MLTLLSIIIIAVVWIAIQSSHGDSENPIAVIAHDGKVVAELELASSSDEVFVLPELPNVQFEINQERIRFVNSQCSDHRCENYGYLNKSNQAAICLPNRVTITIREGQIGQGEIDISVGNGM